VRKLWTNSFCFKFHSGKRVRDFLASELRDLPTGVLRLKVSLMALRLWLREQGRPVQEREILNWICEQSRKEVAASNGTGGTEGAFRRLMFLWSALKDLNERKPGLLRGRRLIEEVISELLSKSYGATPGRIRFAAMAELTPLDSRTLGQNIWEKQRADKSTAQRRRRGERGRAESTPKLWRIAAAAKKCGISKRAMARMLYSDGDVYDKTKKLFRSYKDTIHSIASTMGSAEAEAIVTSARPAVAGDGGK
jgi:hypothetical protein